MKSYVLTVDPGVKAMGFCWWDAKYWKRELQPPVRAEVIFPDRKEKDPYECIRQIMSQFFSIKVAERAVCLRVVCEAPVYFHGAVGRAVAVRGDLTELAISAGVVASLALCHGLKFEAAPANHWKGQLDKEMMQSRIVECLGQAAYSVLSAKRLHDWDACGIGLWAQGYAFN